METRRCMKESTPALPRLPAPLRIPAALILLFFGTTFAAAQEVVSVPDRGWKLWLDREARWEQDSLYLPADVHLARLPVNPPTGGWESLNSAEAITVTLPTTVEEHFWGVNGYRRYRNEEYAYENDDSTVRNGSYLGVSWWVRDVDVPSGFAGKNAVLFIRGARLRAEVYWNQKLVGYSIITESSFTCDVTGALRPGEKNQLAVRITNPGGRMDWVDTQLMGWGSASFHKSHGFGGLDRGLVLTAHGGVFLSDLWARNSPDPKRITACGSLTNATDRALEVPLSFDVLAQRKGAAGATGASCGSSRSIVRVEPHSTAAFSADVVCPAARPWSPERPQLYRLRATLEGSGGGGAGNTAGGAAARGRRSAEGARERREVDFGFRWFEASGIGGHQAMLKLNGERIRLLSAISWGFWGVNGLWPTRELAEREVQAAKGLGMNCMQFHRNTGKAEMLDAQDRLGLLRYMEPGGGQTALGERFSLYALSPPGPVDVSGDSGDAQTFAERYMEEKIIRMVRDHRRHPSLVMYAVQNEIHPDLRNPRIFRILRRVHAEDPSRIVVLKSGFPENKPVNQAWMQPYDDSIYADRGDGYSGWWDAHTVGGPGVWRDEMYRSPGDFTHRTENDSEIVVWGEMLGAPAPDNHAAMVRELRARGGKSYDLKDHEEVLEAYERFLDRWKFRQAFPTPDALFTSIGSRSYDFWGRVVETSRLSEAADFLVMSGWESTAIENHSGLVDNLRGYKGDPALLAKRAALYRPVIKPRSLVMARGSHDTLDLFLFNETSRPHGGAMRVWLEESSGKSTELGSWDVPPHRAGRFVYPVATGVVTPPLESEGSVRIRAEVMERPGAATGKPGSKKGPASRSDPTAHKDPAPGREKTPVSGRRGVSWTEEILVVDEAGKGPLPATVGILSSHPAFARPFEILPGVKAEPYRRGGKYDLLVAANRFVTPPQSGAEPERVIKGTQDQELYRSVHYGTPENFDYILAGLKRGEVTVTFKFAELFRDAPGIRVFDMAVNGTTVLKDFDVFRLAGGKNIALDTTLKAQAPDGIVRITVPRVASGSARLCAIRIEDGDTVIAVRCGGKDYRDSAGLLWRNYMPPSGLDSVAVGEVRQGGVPLLVLSEGEAAGNAYGWVLGNAGAFTYRGFVGEARAPWMGSWYFVRRHPVYEGLPVDCVMGSSYQTGVQNSGGMMVEGPGVEVMAGYSRDHDRNIGAGSFTATLGKGGILFHCVPGVVSGLAREPTGMHPVMLRRLIANSLRYLHTKTAGAGSPR